MNKITVYFFLGFLVFSASSRGIAQSIKGADIKKILEKANIIQEHFTGFALYDEAENKMIYELNSDKYFTPASNTKLFTFYAGLNLLGDSIPGLRYVDRGDSLIFWGTGDPTLMHPELDSKRVINFLKNYTGKLYYSTGNYKAPRRNLGRIAVTSMPVISHVTELMDPTPELTIALLEDALQKPVMLSTEKLPETAVTLYSVRSDSLYRRMLLPSDNYLAEQIVVICASSTAFKSVIDTDSVRAYSKQHFINDLPDTPYWVNGAGFNGNMFTPRSIIALLIKIRDKISNEQRLHELLPNGGVSGTLSEAYKTDNGVPFVFAKTGTLPFVHNQSGYLVTRKGKKLIFSFMNNNFVRTTPEIRNEMVRVMTAIHDNY